MVYVVQTNGSGDVIERMWRLMVSARRNDDVPEIWRLTEEIIEDIRAFYRLGREAAIEGARRLIEPDAAPEADDTPPDIVRFLDIPVDPTTTMPHLLCRPNVVYHL
jgi:hypothetical protein